MKRCAFFVIPLFALLGSVAQPSSLAAFDFPDAAMEREFRELTGEIRCLVCQNESLAGSNAELAADLRQEVYRMLIAGKSRDEIIHFMVARYGDFVLYEPPLKPSTYPLWFGPLLLFLVAAFFLYRTLLKKKRAAETSFSEQDEKRLSHLLNDAPDTPDSKQ